jgi:hypothetical protein
MSTPVLYDLATIADGELEEALADFRWHTPYSAYGFLSHELVDDLVAVAKEYGKPGQLEAVLGATIYDITTDLAHIARIALDLEYLRRADAEPRFESSSAPIAHFLLEDGGDEKAVIARRSWLWHHGAKRGITSNAKRAIRRAQSRLGRMLTLSYRRVDLLSHNLLLDEFLKSTALQVVELFPNAHDWSDGTRKAAGTEEAGSALLDVYCARVGEQLGQAPQQLADLRRLGGAVIAFHLNKAWEDFDQLQAMKLEQRMGTMLVSGTPKHIGRLFAWYYRDQGQEVHRFAHGGERAFYDDYAWGLAELPFCDRYFTHSQDEAENLSRRRAEGRMAPAGPPELVFDSRGSVKHQRLRELAPKHPAKTKTGTLMYVAGGYLGEAAGDFPSRKSPDPLYLDWQISLLRALRDLGYRVITKVHPKGVLREAGFLAPFSDGMEEGSFDPNRYEVDAYIFDFAGSAFFDALASTTGVVLADTGVRPFDSHALADLGGRCAIAQCEQDERGRFRIDPAALSAAVESACEIGAGPEVFFNRYFF